MYCLKRTTTVTWHLNLASFNIEEKLQNIAAFAVIPSFIFDKNLWAYHHSRYLFWTLKRWRFSQILKKKLSQYCWCLLVVDNISFIKVLKRILSFCQLDGHSSRGGIFSSNLYNLVKVYCSHHTTAQSNISQESTYSKNVLRILK